MRQGALSCSTPPGTSVTVFDVAELAVQRRVIDVLCTIRLRRGVRGSRTFTPEMVVFEWAS